MVTFAPPQGSSTASLPPTSFAAGAKAAGAFDTVFSPEARRKLMTAVFEKSTTPIAVTDAAGQIVWSNEALARLIGMGTEDLHRRGVSLYDPEWYAAGALGDLARASAAGKIWRGEIRGRKHNGAQFICDHTVIPVTPTAGQGTAGLLVSVLVDATRRKELEEELIESFPLYQRVVEETSDGLVVVNHDGLVAFCNPAAAAMFSSSVEEMRGQEFGFAFGTAGATTSIEIFTGGTPLFVDMRATPISWQGEDATLVSLHDMTSQREAETFTAMQTKALEMAANGIFITDAKGMIRWTNAAFESMTGYCNAELIGKSPALLKSGKHDEGFYVEMWARASAGELWKGRIVNRHKDGHLYTADQTIAPIVDTTGRLSHFVTIQEDISERLKVQDELVRLAQYDTLTGLPNRHLFLERLTSAIDRADRVGATVAVMVMDLDNFKVINNTLGHDAGDALLVTVTERVSKFMRTTDTLARLGGDDFGILLEGVTDMAAASRTVRRILDCFQESVMIGGQSVKATASLGIAAYPKDDTDPASLLRHAELAMYQAKAEGRHGFKYFNRDMDADIHRRVKLESDLRKALEQKQFWLAYQPQLDLHTNEIVGAEALIRWSHPERGIVSPGEFIPIAEASGIILPIGDWIIEEICRQNAAWKADGMPALQLGFNVSGVQFRQRNLFEQVTATLSRSGLSADTLDIEITETVAMERGGRVQDNVDRLTAAGISISMDDFGTGYSSLSNLQAFPVKRLKVDGSFVRGIGQNRDDEKIVEAVIKLGQSMGLKVVAEGAETLPQVQFLKDLGCDELQGYFLSKPLPPADFTKFVKNFTGLAVA